MKRRFGLAQEVQKQTVHGLNVGTVYLGGVSQYVGKAAVTVRWNTDDYSNVTAG